MKGIMISRNISPFTAKLHHQKRYTSTYGVPGIPFNGKRKNSSGLHCGATGHTVNNPGTKLRRLVLKRRLGITNPGGGIAATFRLTQQLNRCSEDYRQQLNH